MYLAAHPTEKGNFAFLGYKKGELKKCKCLASHLTADHLGRRYFGPNQSDADQIYQK